MPRSLFPSNAIPEDPCPKDNGNKRQPSGQDTEMGRGPQERWQQFVDTAELSLVELEVQCHHGSQGALEVRRVRRKDEQ